MQHVLAMFAACLLYAGSTIAAVPLCRYDYFNDAVPAYLAYQIDQLGNGRWRGSLVWVFSARDLDDDERYLAMVSAATGEVVALEGALGMNGSFSAE